MGIFLLSLQGLFGQTKSLPFYCKGTGEIFRTPYSPKSTLLKIEPSRLEIFFVDYFEAKKVMILSFFKGHSPNFAISSLRRSISFSISQYAENQLPNFQLYGTKSCTPCSDRSVSSGYFAAAAMDAILASSRESRFARYRTASQDFFAFHLYSLRLCSLCERPKSVKKVSLSFRRHFLFSAVLTAGDDEPQDAQPYG
ncbi:hypothetical protein [uncultured Sporomusa sp.]|uniref:hypothetical protein n=1 Tax=uncultured Sporomusa sp. TaxID=307249 RepID=UPI002588C8E9|nr:hypothetical protein [uncultured Sporomusa sp.]